MKRFYLLIITLLLSATWAFGYTERNLLQKQAGLEMLKKVLVLNQEWVQYPDYTDRAGWDSLMGTYKEIYIRRGEKLLDYSWKVIKAMTNNTLAFAPSPGTSPVFITDTIIKRNDAARNTIPRLIF